MSLALLVALVASRKHFDVPGDPDTRPLVLNVVALGSLLGVLVLYELHNRLVPEDLINVLTATVTLLTFRALYLWLRAWRKHDSTTARDRAHARALVEEHGCDTLSYFALRRDKSYFFSPSRRSFLAYGVVGGSALVSGDPVGDTAEFGALLQSFRSDARGRGWRVAILNASGELLPLYRAVGFHALKVGQEAVVRPADFSLEGRPIRKVRQSVSRLRRAGYTASIVGEADLTPSLRGELRRVSEEWRGSWPERGFSMAMDELFGDAGTLFVIARDEKGQVGGFIHLVPSPGSGGYSLSAMRRLRATPNGLMEFLVVEALAWARVNEASEVSLNFCVFADLLRAGDRSLSGRFARQGLQSLDRVFQLERLLSFTGKFFPEWRPRFLCVERLSDFPLVGLAYLRAESLLTPPGPWTRLRRAA